MQGQKSRPGNDVKGKGRASPRLDNVVSHTALAKVSIFRVLIQRPRRWQATLTINGKVERQCARDAQVDRSPFR